MAKISVTIATRNEQENIRNCLESVTWADEIVIVDDMSTDATVKICREYTNTVFQNDSKGSFHVNKNRAIDEATGDWILTLDADEVVSDELQEEIRNAIDQNDHLILGYYICRKNYFLEKWIRGCGWYPNFILRLFRKGTAKWPLEIHDVPSINDPDATLSLKGHLYHYSYSSFDQYWDKFKRYTTRLAQEEYEKGTRIRWYNVLLYFVVKPVYWFLRKYIVLMGIQDGLYGLFLSFSSGLTVFTMYTKLWALNSQA